MEKTITIEGMSCMNCVGAVKNALAQLDELASVEIELENKKARIRGENLEDSLLREAVENAGYKVIEIYED